MLWGQYDSTSLCSPANSLHKTQLQEPQYVLKTTRTPATVQLSVEWTPVCGERATNWEEQSTTQAHSYKPTSVTIHRNDIKANILMRHIDLRKSAKSCSQASQPIYMGATQ